MNRLNKTLVQAEVCNLSLKPEGTLTQRPGSSLAVRVPLAVAISRGRQCQEAWCEESCLQGAAHEKGTNSQEQCGKASQTGDREPWFQGSRGAKEKGPELECSGVKAEPANLKA